VIDFDRAISYKMNLNLGYTLALLVVLLAAGCGRHAESNDGKAGHRHEHHAPHGGTAVVLGEEAFHLECVLDAAAGKLSVYVLDGEMENFVRIGAPSFEIVARVGEEARTLVFSPVANPATGETVTDTALYEASAPWLRTTPSFDAVLRSIVIRGREFRDVPFNFPRGNEPH
jgi:hypothetical protein